LYLFYLFYNISEQPVRGPSPYAKVWDLRRGVRPGT